MTPAQFRELRAIATTGEPTDLYEWHAANSLGFYARDRVLGALLRRELIEDTPSGFVLTDAGRKALEAKGTA